MKIELKLNEKVTLKAKEFLSYFMVVPYLDGQKNYLLKTSACSQLRELICKAFGDSFPSDSRFQPIYFALSAFSKCAGDLNEVRLAATFPDQPIDNKIEASVLGSLISICQRK